MTSSPKEFWGYLIDPQTKGPSPRLEQLLLGIAHYVIKHCEPREHHVLTPAKLSTFYRSVGGDFDSLFVDTPPASLSFIYSALGCYHSLQPSEDPYARPTIPALTTSGFVRWETIQLLLEPDEHAAFLQEAVKIYDIPNKADGSVLGSIFPCTIPRECFPSKPDETMCQWHEDTLQELKRDVDAQPDVPRPKPYRRQTGHPEPGEESDTTDDDDERLSPGGNRGIFFASKLKDKIQQRFGRDSRPNSKDSRDSRDAGDRRYKMRDDLDSGRRDSRRQRGSVDSGRAGMYYSRSSDEAPRRQRHRRAYTGSSYGSPGSPGSPLSPRSPLRPNPPPEPPRRPSERPYLHRERERDPDPSSQPPGGSRLHQPAPDPYARRHSAHYPHSTLAPEDEPPRARSRSHDRSPTRMSPGRFTAAGQPPPRPMSEYFPPPPQPGGAGPTSVPGPMPGNGTSFQSNNFARGRMRHTVHSPSGSPYRGRRRAEESAYLQQQQPPPPPPPQQQQGRRMDEGWRYIPADRLHMR